MTIDAGEFHLNLMAAREQNDCIEGVHYRKGTQGATKLPWFTLLCERHHTTAQIAAAREALQLRYAKSVVYLYTLT